MSLTLEPVPDPAVGERKPKAEGTAGGSRHAGLKLIGKRALIYLVTLIGAVTVNFIIPRVMPGDPTQETVNRLQAKTGQTVPPATVDAIRSILGDPHQNIVGQYFTYWKRLLHGDLGLSTSHYPVKVTTLIGDALPWTVGLVLISIIGAWIVGVALGALGGWNRGRRTDTGLSLFSAAMIGIPSFWLALMLQYVAAYKLGWLPSGGAYDPNLVPSFTPGFVFSVLRYGVLPGFTFAAVSFASYYFGMRNLMAVSSSDDYVLLARAKGLSRRRVLTGYAARNAILPSVAGLAQSLGGAVGGVIIIEIIFTYPGLGSLMISGIAGYDFPLIQGVFLVVTIAVLVMNFIADSIYVLIDPRTREVPN